MRLLEMKCFGMKTEPKVWIVEAKEPISFWTVWLPKKISNAKLDLAEKYLHKGSLIYIEGRLRTRSWEDKDGNKKFATEVVADNLIMLDKRADGTAGPGSGEPDYESLPF